MREGGGRPSNLNQPLALISAPHDPAMQIRRTEHPQVKSATIPSLRIAPEVWEAAESVLREGETLSSFVEQSVKANILRRRVEKAFVEKGLASAREARGSGEYVSAEAVLEELSSMLKSAGRANVDLQQGGG